MSGIILPCDCKIEIGYINPETYASVVNHKLRKEILKALYRMSVNGPISKQQIADRLGVNYHQLIYQLNNQLKEFWMVREEKKVRGTRMELIEPAKPHTVFITFGSNDTIFLVDPMANLFGQLSRVGTRCDVCTEEDARRCVEHMNSACSCAQVPSEAEKRIMLSNGRRPLFRVVDHAIICAIEGLPKGEKCKVEIPCESCSFIRKIE